MTVVVPNYIKKTSDYQLLEMVKTLSELRDECKINIDSSERLQGLFNYYEEILECECNVRNIG